MLDVVALFVTEPPRSKCTANYPLSIALQKCININLNQCIPLHRIAIMQFQHLHGCTKTKLNPFKVSGSMLKLLRHGGVSKIFLEDHQLITYLITYPATPGLSL